jgi:hypothetical protein
MAALMAGQSIGEVAGEYRLPETTVREWAKGQSFVEVRAKKERDFDELIGGYLEDILVTLSLQARAVRDETWIKQQPASEIAVLHGVLADKAFRLLTARAAAEEAAGDAAGESQ